MNRKSAPSSRPAKNSKAGFSDDKGSARGKKPFAKKDDDASPRPSRGAGKKDFRKSDDDRKPFRSADGDRKPFKRSGEDKPFRDGDKKRSFDRNSDDRKPFRSADGERKPFKRSGEDKPFRDGDKKRSFDRNSDDRKPFRSADGERKPFKKRDDDNSFRDTDRKKSFDRTDKPSFRKRGDDERDGDRPFKKREDSDTRPFRKRGDDSRPMKDNGGDRPFKKRDDREEKPFRKRDDDKPFKKRDDREEKPFRKRDDERKSFGEAKDGERKPFKKRDDDKKYESPGRMKSFEQEDLSFGKKARADARKAAKELEAAAAEPTDSDNAAGPQEEPTGKPVRDIYEPLAISEEKKKNKKEPVIRKDPSRAVRKEDSKPIAASRDNKPYYTKDEAGKTLRKRTYKQADEPTEEQREEAKKEQRAASWQKKTEKKRARFDEEDDDDIDEDDKEEAMPLNKYLAHSGVCSRREAAQVVKDGKVRVNDHVETNPGYKVADNDVVYYNDKKLTLTKGLVYILLNKPKDYITTNDDPQGRKTVMDLVANAGVDRLFPVGRLDRNTTGLLLLTNDGELTQKLAHPSFKVKKIYQVTTDKPVTKADFDKILNGLELEDGKAPVDALAYLETKNELGIEIHIGRNRIVRRIFESLGYEVVKLDRVMYGSLTKKNLPRGKWRFLSDRELVLLKHFKS